MRMRISWLIVTVLVALVCGYALAIITHVEESWVDKKGNLRYVCKAWPFNRSVDRPSSAFAMLFGRLVTNETNNRWYLVERTKPFVEDPYRTGSHNDGQLLIRAQITLVTAYLTENPRDNIFKLAAGYSDAIDKSGVGGVDSYAAEMLENAIDNVDQP